MDVACDGRVSTVKVPSEAQANPSGWQFIELDGKYAWREQNTGRILWPDGSVAGNAAMTHAPVVEAPAAAAVPSGAGSTIGPVDLAWMQLQSWLGTGVVPAKYPEPTKPVPLKFNAADYPPLLPSTPKQQVGGQERSLLPALAIVGAVGAAGVLLYMMLRKD